MSPTSEPAHDAKRIRRETAREARRQELRRVERRRRTRNLAIVGGLAAGVLAIVGWLVWPAFRSGPSGTVPQGAQVAGQGARAAYLGERIDDQGRDHISRGQPHPAYNSNPPTSGWHTPEVANWGSFRTELPDELVLHNLEHGGVWISYKDPGDGTLVEKLEGLVSRYRSKVIVTPRAKNDRPIAVAAWGRLMKLDAYDEKRIVAFIEAFRNKGPERVPD